MIAVRALPALSALLALPLLAGCAGGAGGASGAGPAPGTASAADLAFEVAVIEFNPVLGDKQPNEDRMVAEMDAAFAGGARLVVTPEMANTGYHFTERSEIEPLVEPIPGPWTERLTRLARKHDGYIATSMPEVDPDSGLFYISAVLVGPGGVVGVYRKTHLWQQEELWAARGDLGVPVFSTPLGTIAFNICMDVVFWEPARVAALKGADILIVPTNSSGQTVSLLQAIAAQNGIYVIGANRAGRERDFHMVGLSGTWSPDGEPLGLTPLLAESEGTQASPAAASSTVRATIQPARARARRTALLARRRPELYKVIAAYSPFRPRAVPTAAQVRLIPLEVEPAPADVEENLRRLGHALAAATAGQPARSAAPALAVAPELSLTGPIDAAVRDPAGLRRLAGATEAGLPAVAALAREHRVHLMVGALRPAAPGSPASGYRNAALLFGPDGALLAEYSKTHLEEDERAWLQPGAALGYVDVPALGRIGILLGEEADVPEIAGALAVRRVDLIAVLGSIRQAEARHVALPAAFARGAYQGRVPLAWDAAARFGQAYVVGASYRGAGYAGGSGVVGIDPIYGLDRPHLVEPGAPGLAAPVDLARAAGWWFNQQHMIVLRRPGLYREIVTRAALPARPPASGAAAPR